MTAHDLAAVQAAAIDLRHSRQVLIEAMISALRGGTAPEQVVAAANIGDVDVSVVVDLAETRRELEAAIEDQDFQRAAELRDKLRAGGGYRV